jgi:hypothetical protein
MQLLKDRESITKKQMDYFRSPETRTLSRNMSHLVSFWINDEAHRRAITCKAVNVKADFRYQSAPHDAFIDRKNGEISVASSDDNILGNLPYPEKSQGIRMFKGWDIELQPVSPVKYTCKRAPNTQQQEVRYA